MPDKTRKRVRGGMRGKYTSSSKRVGKSLASQRKKPSSKTYRHIPGGILPFKNLGIPKKKLKSKYPDVYGLKLEKALNKIIKKYESTESVKKQSDISALSAAIIGHVYEDMIGKKNNMTELLNMFDEMKLIKKKNNTNKMLEETIKKATEEGKDDPIKGLETLIELIHNLRRKYLKEKDNIKSGKYGLFIDFLGDSIQKGIDKYIKPVNKSVKPVDKSVKPVDDEMEEMDKNDEMEEMDKNDEMEEMDDLLGDLKKLTLKPSLRK